MLQVVAEHAATLVITDPDRYPVERFVSFATTMLAAIEQGPGDRDLPPPKLEI
jgi:hypothetical protein